MRKAMPLTASVIQPSVPLCTWLINASWPGSQRSSPFRIPITIV